MFEDFRNTALNANSWYNNAVGLPRNPIILNDFGGSAGGHIIKDKLFYFVSFAMAKQPGGFTVTNVSGSNADSYGGILTQPSNNAQVNILTQVAQPHGLPYVINSQIAAEGGSDRQGHRERRRCCYRKR